MGPFASTWHQKIVFRRNECHGSLSRRHRNEYRTCEISLIDVRVVELPFEELVRRRSSIDDLRGRISGYEGGIATCMLDARSSMDICDLRVEERSIPHS